MRFRTLEVYGLATLQGPHTPGRRSLGIPPGGPFDRESAALANALVGNSVDAPVIELGLGTLVMDAPVGGTFAVVGAECSVRVDGRERPSQSAVAVRDGAYVEVGVRAVGARLYLAAPGGFATASIEGGVRVAQRTAIESVEDREVPEARLAEPPSSLVGDVLRVLPGPRGDVLPNVRLGGEWRVRAQSDRVGVRLDGDAPAHQVELPSEPMCVGAVQATPKGGLLVLGPDGPTLGGYPHIATVIEADLDRVAQLRPRDIVSLLVVTEKQAKEARRRSLARLERTLFQLHLYTGRE